MGHLANAHTGLDTKPPVNRKRVIPSSVHSLMSSQGRTIQRNVFTFSIIIFFLFNKYLPSDYYVPGIGHWKCSGGSTNKLPALWSLESRRGKKTNKTISESNE